MQHSLKALLPNSLRPNIPIPLQEAVRDRVTIAVGRGMAGRPYTDREDVTQVAFANALGRICHDGSDPMDAANLAAFESVRRFRQDARANREVAAGTLVTDMADSGELTADSLSAVGGWVAEAGSAESALPMGGWVAPDHLTRTTVRDVYTEAMEALHWADPVLWGAVNAWRESADSMVRRGSTPTLKGMLARRIRRVLPRIAAEVIVRHARESGTAKPFRTVCGHRSCVAIAFRTTGRRRNRADSVGPMCEWADTTDPREGAWVTVESADSVVTGPAGREVGIRDRESSGPASPVVSRMPIAGPACESCDHPMCAVIRSGRYVPLTPNQLGALTLVRANPAHVATDSDRRSDDWAFATTPVGPVVKPSGRRKSGGKGAVGTSVTVKGPRHPWGERTDGRP